MEGLIPFVIHAIKRRRRDRSTYRCLSRGRSLRMQQYPPGHEEEEEEEVVVELGQDSFHHRDHQHRRTRSELPPLVPSGRRLGASRSLREVAAVAFPPTDAAAA